MELHPTSEAWRTALLTACGASVLGMAAVVAALTTDRLLVLCIFVGLAKHYAWNEVAAVTVIERRVSNLQPA